MLDAIVQCRKSELLLDWKVIQRLASSSQVPVRPMHPEPVFGAEHADGLRLIGRAVTLRPSIQSVDLVLGAQGCGDVDLPSCAIIGQLSDQRLSNDADFLMPLPIVDDLLERECHQDAEYNDTHFARELTPAVQ